MKLTITRSRVKKEIEVKLTFNDQELELLAKNLLSKESVENARQLGLLNHKGSATDTLRLAIATMNLGDKYEHYFTLSKASPTTIQTSI